MEDVFEVFDGTEGYHIEGLGGAGGCLRELFGARV